MSTRQDRTSLLLQRAKAAGRKGRNDEARRLLKAALRHDPTNEQALLWLVHLAEDDQARLTYLARLLDAHPHHPKAKKIIRWTQRRIPTSALTKHKETPPPSSRAPRRLLYGLTMLALLLGLGIAWQIGQSPAAAVQAGASLATPQPATPAPDIRSLAEIVQVSIPLFTPTPTPTPIPTHTPTPSPTAPPTPSSAWVPVAGHPQTYNLSCESRSAADLAAYWDVPLDEGKFLTTLGWSDNPHQGFVGDVDILPGSLPPYGYGVYAEPVAAALREYGLDAHSIYNLGLDRIRTELLAGRPVLVWATYRMEPHEPLEWVSSDGQSSTVIPFMHTFLIVGFNGQGFYFLDAYDATIQHYDFDTFLNVWNDFDQMAVLVTGQLP